MKNIHISDVTLNTALDSGRNALNFREKIEIAKLLDRLDVDVIEAGAIVNEKTDSLLIKAISTAVKTSCIAVLVDPEDKESVAKVHAALKDAPSYRMQVVIPVSTVQMEYICHRKPAAVLELIKESVSECKQYAENVEFIAEDAVRSDQDFLFTAIDVALEAGANVITVCDAEGSLLPSEVFEKISDIRKKVPENVTLGVRCANDLYMATASCAAAIRAGADEIKTCAGGIKTTELDKIVAVLSSRGDSLNAFTNVKTTEMQRVISKIHEICETTRSDHSPFDFGVREEEGIFLTAKDDMAAVTQAAKQLGYELSDEDAVSVYNAFVHIAEKKEQVGQRELDAIIASAAMQVPATYSIENYIINSGNKITASAHMKLVKDGKVLESVCLGDGPIDAAFLAIEQILGRHFELDDFQIKSVTEGHEAMGETVVRLRSGGKLYSGRGISTDIIGSGIRAYINAVNKIVFEEEEK